MHPLRRISLRTVVLRTGLFFQTPILQSVSNRSEPFSKLTLLEFNMNLHANQASKLSQYLIFVAGNILHGILDNSTEANSTVTNLEFEQQEAPLLTSPVTPKEVPIRPISGYDWLCMFLLIGRLYCCAQQTGFHLCLTHFG